MIEKKHLLAYVMCTKKKVNGELKRNNVRTFLIYLIPLSLFLIRSENTKFIISCIEITGFTLILTTYGILFNLQKKFIKPVVNKKLLLLLRANYFVFFKILTLNLVIIFLSVFDVEFLQTLRLVISLHLSIEFIIFGNVNLKVLKKVIKNIPNKRL